MRTGNLVYALFQHDTSRKTDPQSHIHALIAKHDGFLSSCVTQTKSMQRRAR